MMPFGEEGGENVTKMEVALRSRATRFVTGPGTGGMNGVNQ